MVVATASRIGQFPAGETVLIDASSRARCQVSADTTGRVAMTDGIESRSASPALSKRIGRD